MGRRALPVPHTGEIRVSGQNEVSQQGQNYHEKSKKGIPGKFYQQVLALVEKDENEQDLLNYVALSYQASRRQTHAIIEDVSSIPMLPAHPLLLAGCAVESAPLLSEIVPQHLRGGVLTVLDRDISYSPLPS